MDSKEYNPTTVCFISFCKLPSDTTLHVLHKVISVGLIIDYMTGIVEDVITSLIVTETREFVKSLIMGRNIHVQSITEIINCVKFRYHGAAQRAICLGLKQSYDKYMVWREEQLSKR
jgi:hypothetical protein